MNKIVSALLISALAVSFSSKPQPPYKADVYRMVSSANTGETEGEKNDGDNHPEFEPYEKIEDTYALPEGCEFTTDFIDMGDDWDDDASDDGSEEPAAKPTPEASPTPTTKPKSVFNMTKKQMNKLTGNIVMNIPVPLRKLSDNKGSFSPKGRKLPWLLAMQRTRKLS